jgi:hypothetical protein
MRGQTARRIVRHIDPKYGYESSQLLRTEPLPHSLGWLRERCTEFAGVTPEALAQTLVTRYSPGATIGWHRDAPVFGPVVVGVSLQSACVMRFQRRMRDQRRVYEAELARARPTSSPAALDRHGSTASPGARPAVLGDLPARWGPRPRTWPMLTCSCPISAAGWSER